MTGTVEMIHQMNFPDSILRSRQINYGMVEWNLPRRPKWVPSVDQVFSQRSAKDADFYVKEYCFRPSPKWVSTRQELEELVEILKKSDEFAVKVREYKGDAITEFITTLQISTWDDGDFLIEAMELYQDILELMKEPLENGKIIKIFYKAEKQVLALQREYGIYTYGVADLDVFGAVANPQFPETFMLVCQDYAPHYFCTLEPPPKDKWMRRGFGCKQIWFFFLAHQVHLLLRMFNKVKNNMQPEQIFNAFDSSAEISKLLYTQTMKKRLDPLQAILRMFKRVSHSASGRGEALPRLPAKALDNMVALSCWRDQISKNFNLVPEAVISDLDFFLVCSASKPEAAYVQKMLPNLGLFVESQAQNILNIITSDRPGQAASDFNMIICRNCMLSGHGPALFCIYSRTIHSACLKFFLDRPENMEKKIAYEARRDAFFARQLLEERYAQ